MVAVLDTDWELNMSTVVNRIFLQIQSMSFSCNKAIVGNVTRGSCDDSEPVGYCDLDSYKPPGRRCKFCPDTKQDVSASLMGFQNIEKVS